MTHRALSALAAIGLAATLLTACSDSSDGKGAQPSPSCPTPLAKPTFEIKLSQIYLNVYNAGEKAGSAGKAASDLKWRGAHVLKTGNDPNPDGRPVPERAEIRYGPNGRQIALTLAQQVQDPVLHQDDRTNPTVDLVLGDDFALVPVPPPPASRVTVNVYNTTYHAGLAGKVAASLKERGFKIESDGNDPNGQFLPDDTAVIRYGEHYEPAAKRLALQVKGARLVKDGRDGEAIDLVIGSKWTDLVPAAQATPTPSTTSKPPGC